MFLGQYTHSLDDKGRLTLPAKFRERLSKGIVVTNGLDGCLFVFTDEGWERFTTILGEHLPVTQQDARDLIRFFYGGASDQIPDRQGRILIPPFLRRYANLESEVKIVGANSRLELWNPDAWQQRFLGVESNIEQIAEKFGNITF